MPKLLQHLSLRSMPGYRTYPWPEYLDGAPRRFERGEDFDGHAKTFRERARRAAERLGVVIETRCGEGWLELQAVRWEGELQPPVVTAQLGVQR